MLVSFNNGLLQLMLETNFAQYFEAEVFSPDLEADICLIFKSLIMVEILKLRLSTGFKLAFGRDFESEFWQ